ncbi:hypothetical protein BALAC2494_02006 [Bifidobacterium animalis subsp. lactis CNCM I-2494]|uniref:Uncharacterized protein n=1 Tax=Bifidobacterium animalis subsp. lactis CNCM I-2494 TaxID=1042403 RepID=A0A806FN43_BIFAN|nr:hypothetical protein BALAC2494_02006 [Bifidobacterium animalis subsp. lactis CNCM I-2494]
MRHSVDSVEYKDGKERRHGGCAERAGAVEAGV